MSRFLFHHYNSDNTRHIAIVFFQHFYSPKTIVKSRRYFSTFSQKFPLKNRKISTRFFDFFSKFSPNKNGRFLGYVLVFMKRFVYMACGRRWNPVHVHPAPSSGSQSSTVKRIHGLTHLKGMPFIQANIGTCIAM